MRLFSCRFMMLIKSASMEAAYRTTSFTNEPELCSEILTV